MLSLIKLLSNPYLSRKKLLSKIINIVKEFTFKMSVYITSSSVTCRKSVFSVLTYILMKCLLYNSICEITFKLSWHT